MRTRPLPMLLVAALALTACGGGIEPLSVTEADWCRRTQPVSRLIDQAATQGIDLTETITAARAAEALVTADGGDIIARMGAFFEVLEADEEYIGLCRTLYTER